MTHVICVAAFSGLSLLVAACGSSTPSTDDSGHTKSTSNDKGTPRDPSPRDPSQGNSSQGNPSQGNPSQADLGALCTQDPDCAENLCVYKGSSPRGVCTKLCSNVTDCPGGYTAWDDCAEVKNVTGKVCIPKT